MRRGRRRWWLARRRFVCRACNSARLIRVAAGAKRLTTLVAVAVEVAEHTADESGGDGGGNCRDQDVRQPVAVIHSCERLEKRRWHIELWWP